MVKLRAGFTLMELLVVQLIIGILSTVAIRTIDATRGRALFDQTAEEMQQLTYSIVGNPNMLVDGRRVDFGFYGDLGRLPNSLDELTASSDPRWKGPYVRREFLGDSLGYLSDAWGNPYTYDAATGVITTIGDGKYPMTVRVADSLPQLVDNSIVGTVADGDNNPPGEAPVVVYLRMSNGNQTSVPTDDGGYYRFEDVPIGTHQLTAYYLVDSVTRWVSVAPRTRSVVDFRFSRPFRNFLRMVGQPQLSNDSAGFTVTVVNTLPVDVNVRNVLFATAPDSAWFRALTWNGATMPGYPLVTSERGYGVEDSMPMNRISPSTNYPIQGNMSEEVTFGFLNCRVDSLGLGDLAKINGGAFRLRFSDGSEISFTLPVSP